MEAWIMNQRATGTFETEAAASLPCLGNLSFDRGAFRFYLEGELVRLTLREFELLRLLFEQPDRVIAYETLAAALWPEPAKRSVRHLNETVRGRGYGLLRGRSDGSRPAA
jgi:DNA-binding response OmpR family regulator